MMLVSVALICTCIHVPEGSALITVADGKLRLASLGSTLSWGMLTCPKARFEPETLTVVTAPFVTVSGLMPVIAGGRLLAIFKLKLVEPPAPERVTLAVPVGALEAMLKVADAELP